MTHKAQKLNIDTNRLPAHKNKYGIDCSAKGNSKAALSELNSPQFQSMDSGDRILNGVERIADPDCVKSLVVGDPGIGGYSACFTVSLKGEHKYQDDRGTVRLREGDVCISPSQGAHISNGIGACHKVRVSPSILADGLMHAINSPTVVRRESPAARVLKKIMEKLEQELQQDNLGCAIMIAKMARDVVSLLITENERRQKSDGPAFLRAQVRNFVEDNLSDSDLSVQQIADMMNVSKATLYRSFTEVGGVREFVTQVRLNAALKMLESGSLQHGDIKHIAYCCGFKSPNTLNRTFKKRYGIPPSQYCQNHVDGLVGPVV